MASKIKLFEMFAGFGGARYSLEKANIPYESVGYSEIKKEAIRIYQLNFSEGVNYGDCVKIDPNNLPNFDLLTAGFPCQDVSMAGKNDLSQGRTTLFSEIIRIAIVKKPKYMLLENVKGILSKKHKDFFNYILSSLDKAGYIVYFKLLNSKDFNTPQSRERVYFVCVKKGLPKAKIFGKKSFKFPEKEIYRNDWRNYKDNPKNFKKVNKTPSRDDMRIKCKNITKLSYCQTITLKQDRWPNAGIIDYEDYYRFLTPREQFRLMGFFYDEIDISGFSVAKLENLVGDGWDINLVSKIFWRLFCI
jgi:DNA (cytosine-5)-methyltransferase 1